MTFLTSLSSAQVLFLTADVAKSLWHLKPSRFRHSGRSLLPAASQRLPASGVLGRRVAKGWDRAGNTSKVVRTAFFGRIARAVWLLPPLGCQTGAGSKLSVSAPWFYSHRGTANPFALL